MAEIPGIGPLTARALLQRFGSVGGVAAADPSELTAVPGVGPQRAATLLRVLTDVEHFLAKAWKCCPASRSVFEIGITGGTCVACSDRAEPRHLRGSP